MEQLDILIDKLSKRVDEFEIVKKEIKKLSVKIEKGKVENLKESEETLHTLRVIKNKRIGLTYFTVLSDIDDILDNVVSLSEIADFDNLNGFYKNEFNENNFNLLNNAHKISLEEMTEFSRILEESAYKEDKRVVNVKEAGCFKGKTVVTYYNSNNSAKQYATDYCGASVAVVSKEAESNMLGYEYLVSKNFDFSPEKIAKTAVNKSVRMLNAKKGSTYKFPAIIENELVGDILSILAPSFYIENIIKNKSMFSNVKDKNIAFEKINLSDDGTNPEFIGSALFDDEGTPTNKKYLIKNGLLNEFLYNYYYAKKEKKKFAGNSFLPGFKSNPEITYTNLILEPSNEDFEGFLLTVDKAILITNLMGLHMADPISGEFSLGAEGILIENGELTQPVKEFVISGNILDILKNCRKVFNDSKVNGRIISPSIIVEGLKLIGN